MNDSLRSALLPACPMRLIAAFVLVCAGFLAWPAAAADPVAAALKAGGSYALEMPYYDDREEVMDMLRHGAESELCRAETSIFHSGPIKSGCLWRAWSAKALTGLVPALHPSTPACQCRDPCNTAPFSPMLSDDRAKA